MNYFEMSVPKRVTAGWARRDVKCHALFCLFLIFEQRSYCPASKSRTSWPPTPAKTNSGTLTCYSLNSNFSGGSLPNGAKCAAMAFADNIIILSDHEVEVPLMLGTVEEFLRERRMSVNPAKCRTIVTGVVAGRTAPRTKRSTYGDGDV
jgi:hypothetical protein